MESSGIITSNRELVSNQAHTRNFMVSSPTTGIEKPDMSAFDDESGLPDPDKIQESFWRKGRYPLLKEVMEDMMGPMSFDDVPDSKASTIDETTTLDELLAAGYINANTQQQLIQGEGLDYEYEIVDFGALEAIASDTNLIQQFGPDQADMIAQMISNDGSPLSLQQAAE